MGTERSHRKRWHSDRLAPQPTLCTQRLTLTKFPAWRTPCASFNVFTLRCKRSKAGASSLEGKAHCKPNCHMETAEEVWPQRKENCVQDWYWGPGDCDGLIWGVCESQVKHTDPWAVCGGHCQCLSFSASFAAQVTFYLQGCRGLHLDPTKPHGREAALSQGWLCCLSVLVVVYWVLWLNLQKEALVSPSSQGLPCPGINLKQ